MAPDFIAGPTNHHFLTVFLFSVSQLLSVFISLFASLIHFLAYVVNVYYIVTMSQSLYVIRQTCEDEKNQKTMPCHHGQGGLKINKKICSKALCQVVVNLIHKKHEVLIQDVAVRLKTIWPPVEVFTSLVNCSSADI